MLPHAALSLPPSSRFLSPCTDASNRTNLFPTWKGSWHCQPGRQAAPGPAWQAGGPSARTRGNRRRRAARPPPARASLPGDIPFVAAAALSIATSASPLLLPQASSRGWKLPGSTPESQGDLSNPCTDSNERDAAQGGATADASPLEDMRYGLMTALSAVPFFNWMSWLLAYFQNRDPKYAVYAAVYAAPLLRFGLDFTPEDSWAPWLCYAACLAHVQIDFLVATSTRAGLPEPQITDIIASRPDSGASALQEQPQQQPEALEPESSWELRRWDQAFEESLRKEKKGKENVKEKKKEKEMEMEMD